MIKIDNISNIVHQILIDKPETREDDYLLLYEILDDYKVTHTNVDYVLINHTMLELPSIESIIRCRRKIQALQPELAGREMRKEFEKLETIEWNKKEEK